jgi:hypothetical protein
MPKGVVVRRADRQFGVLQAHVAGSRLRWRQSIATIAALPAFPVKITFRRKFSARSERLNG